MSSNLQDFETFLRLREHAATAFVKGDPAPLERLVTADSPATFFGPGGGYIQGADDVSSIYQRDATRFEGGHTDFEIFHMAASDGLAYWVGVQRANARLVGNAKAVPFYLRVTEVFRREAQEWKLIHRHADAMASEPGGENDQCES